MNSKQTECWGKKGWMEGKQQKYRNVWRKETFRERKGVNKGAERGGKVRWTEEEIRWCKSGSEKARGAKERGRREGCRGPFSVESNPSWIKRFKALNRRHVQEASENKKRSPHLALSGRKSERERKWKINGRDMARNRWNNNQVRYIWGFVQDYAKIQQWIVLMLLTWGPKVEPFVWVVITNL